jgi:hypothetical protein
MRRGAPAVGALLLAGVAFALAACAGPSTPAAAPPSAGSATSSTVVDEAKVLVATYADNGATLTVHLGDQIKVELAGMAWTFEPSSNTAVAEQHGPSATLPASTGCIFDVGCGSVSALFTIGTTGRAVLHASRANCTGTAGSCVTGPAAFTLIVAVVH